ncbi:UPF0182 family protein [Propionibacteriaceae bacterium G1746]|uniref:UPF0182 family membrane protein n=1 Tax=Aestuariimicrobium sp. G57 TaxID=3418485 RepID=UPI003C22698F
MSTSARRAPAHSPGNRARIGLWIVGGLLALLIAFGLFSRVWTDWLWFRSLDMTSVYTTQLGTSITLFLVFGLVMAAIVGGNAWLALKLRPKTRGRAESAMVERSRELIEKRTTSAVVIPAAVVGLFAGIAGGAQTMTYLAWREKTPFGVEDPWTGLDASFFVFDYPWWQFIIGFLLAALVISTMIAISLHFIVGALRSLGPRVLSSSGQNLRALQSPFSPAAQTHLSILFALLLVVWAGQLLLDRVGYSIGTSGMFTGVGYTDDNARSTAKLIMVVIALLCATLFAINARVRRWSLAGLSIVTMIISSLVVSGIYPALLQQIYVKPSEQDKERPYIQAHLDATRQAYGLNNVQIQEGYTARTTATAGQLKADAEALPAIRLMDPSLISPAVEHLQQVRGYYSFQNVLDVDRYTIDGKATDIVLAAREVDVNNIDQSWNNLHTVYTHGYGLVAAMGNQSQSNGEPVWAAGGIPVTGTLPEHEPRIYFGELASQYVVVGAPQGTAPVEFDQPTGNQGDATKNTYSGKGGVPIGNPITRLSYAARFADANLLLSNRVNADSKIMYDRQPLQRVQQVAPWLTWDKDTYPAVVNGRVVWIVDGYTTSANYPNSQRTDLRTATSDAVSDTMRMQQDKPVNYMRNSVKGIVDAYDGTVTLYAWDEAEPVLQTWLKVFPDVLQPKSAIPAELLSHLRYPQDLFKVQRQMMTRYHTTNALTWVQGSDVWQVPDDPVKAGGKKEPPYYLSIKWPGDPQPVYSQTATFVPSGRENLRSYMAVNADASSPDYGKIRVLQMDDANQIAGPGQTMNAITTDPVVAEKLRPFLNQGSATAMYGNLMTLPLGGGLLYVLPIYTERQVGSAGYPALQFVAVRFGEHVGIGETLQQALDSVFGGDSGASTDENEPDDQTPNNTPPTEVDAQITKLLGEADASFAAADAALKAGDLAAYQKHIADARTKVAQALALQKNR